MTLTGSLKLPSLRSLLGADIVTCSLAALLMTLGANPLADVTDLPVNLLRLAGLALVPYVAALIALATRDEVPRTGAIAVVAANLAWVVGSMAILLSGQIDPNGLGIAFVLVQAAAVFLLAELQLTRLRANT